MGSEWQEYPLEDCMDAIIDYRGKTPTKTSSGIPLITAKIIKNGRIENVSEFIAEDDYESWMRRGIPEAGDIVMTTEAPLGEVAQLDNRKIALAQRVITLRGKKGLLDNTFLKYLIISQYVQHQLDGRGTGTTVKGIKQSELRKILLKFPSYDEQKAIAHILGSLDDKIELNRQMNATLESMAQALFKSWFVDFDPVIDNAIKAGNEIPDVFAVRAELRRSTKQQKTGGVDSNNEINSLFPSEFEFTEEMGWIPKGWGVVRYKEIVEKYIDNRGKTPPLSESGIPLLEVKHLPENSIKPNLNTTKFVSDEVYETWFRSHLEVDDLIISTVGTIGRICIVPEGEKFTIAQNLLGLRFKKESVSQTFMYYQMDGFRFRHDVDARLVTTVQASIKRKDLETIDLLCPSIEAQRVFEKFVKPLMEKQNSNQNLQLAELRDTLLPKLISGELRIPDAEKLIKEALV